MSEIRKFSKGELMAELRRREDGEREARTLTDLCKRLGDEALVLTIKDDRGADSLGRTNERIRKLLADAMVAACEARLAALAAEEVFP